MAVFAATKDLHATTGALKDEGTCEPVARARSVSPFRRQERWWSPAVPVLSPRDASACINTRR